MIMRIKITQLPLFFLYLVIKLFIKGVIISFGSDLIISETEVRSSFPVSYGSSESKLSDLVGLVPEYAITAIEVYQME